MKCLTLKVDNRVDYTTVSNVFIDNYMPMASGEFVKIYLYLLRCIADPSMDVSVSSIADKFDHTEKDVLRALRYFASKGLLEIEYGDDDELSTITLLPINSEFTVIKNTPSSPITEKAVIKDNEEPIKKPVYTTTQLKAFADDEEFSQLLYITQKYIGSEFGATGAQTIMYLYDTLKFSSELIEYLIEYSVNNNHKSLRYIEKVGLDWANNNIRTVEDARLYTANYNSKIYSVMKAFGISGRNPGLSELKLIDKWYDEYCFDNEMILEACNRTIRSIHSPSFEYADKILSAWKESNFKTLSDIEKAKDSTPKQVKLTSATKPAKQTNKFNDFSQRTYDFSKIEKQIMEE